MKTERELKSQAYLETKKQDANEQLEFDWDETEAIVTGKFGYLSKQDMYIKFFAENPSRDDLGDLTINPERASGNYIRITGNDMTFYLNEYKTKGQYGQIKKQAVSRIIGANQGVHSDQWAQRWRRAVWEGQDERFREQVGHRSGRSAGWYARCGINVLRRIYVSTKVRQGLSETERFELALAMKHTPLATLKYIRQFKDKTDDAAANNELPKSY